MKETNSHTSEGRQHWNRVHQGRWSNLGFISSFMVPVILVAVLAMVFGPFPVGLVTAVAMIAGLAGIGFSVYQERKWRRKREDAEREQRNARAAERDKQMMEMLFGHQADH